MAYKQVSPIPVVEGGTGNTTLTDGGILIGSGTSPITATAQPTNGQLLIGSTGNDPALGSLTSPDFSLDIGYDSPNITAQINPNIRKSFGYYQNLGISYDSGTGVFSVRGADADLSASNPAYITLDSKSTIGETLTVEITANQSFIDANGASEIIGNLFGFTTGVALSDVIPFYIYAVLDDTESNISFMISRIPGKLISPAAGSIGTPASAIADTEQSFFAFESITTTDYDSNPCVMIGSTIAIMDASDDWTFSSSTKCGIGKFAEDLDFLVPLGQFGANSGTLVIANGGTAPLFGTQSRFYRVDPWNQQVIYGFRLADDAGADGSGAVPAQIIIPYISHVDAAYLPIANLCGSVQYRVASGNYQLGAAYLVNNTHTMQIARNNNANQFLNWADFSNGDRRIMGVIIYPIDFN